MLGDLDPTLLNSEVVDLESKVRAAFPLELQYACRYWPSHFAAAVEEGPDDVVVNALEIFAAKL